MEYLDRLDDLFSRAFQTNHPAMLDWAETKMLIKRLRAERDELRRCASYLCDVIDEMKLDGDEVDAVDDLRAAISRTEGGEVGE